MNRVIQFLSSIYLSLFLFDARAASWSYTPSAELGHKTGKFDIVGSNSTSVDATLSTLNLSLSAASNKWFVTGRYEMPLSTSRRFHYGGSRVFDDSVERADASITIGYRLNQTFNIFFGALDGKTNLSRVDYLPSLSLDEFFEFRYRESGPFAGVAAGIPVGKESTLSGSIAYGVLSGDIEILRNGLSSKVSGLTANGFSLGINFRSPLTSSTSYNVSYKVNRYAMKNVAETVALNEEFGTLYVGITRFY